MKIINFKQFNDNHRQNLFRNACSNIGGGRSVHPTRVGVCCTSAGSVVRVLQFVAVNWSLSLVEVLFD